MRKGQRNAHLVHAKMFMERKQVFRVKKPRGVPMGRPKLELLASYSVPLPSVIPSTQIKLIAAVQNLKSHERIALKLTAEAVAFVFRAEPCENVHKMAVQSR